jgi:hypothetical protein
MEHKRKAIPKSVRFEVFKRDSFTCQYCGRKAPDVVLEVDHINPVANGGENDILNLVTSCRDCNGGKGAKLLTDHQAIDKQREQLEELNDRREQMEMMIEWKTALLSLDETKIDAIETMFRKATGYGFSTVGRETIRKAIKQRGFETVIDATNTSIHQYYKGDANSIGKTFDFIPRIAFCMQRQQTDPLYGRKRRIHRIIEQQHSIYNDGRLWKALNALCIDEESTNRVEELARAAQHWTHFWQEINYYFGGNW